LLLPPDRAETTSLQAEILGLDHWEEIAHNRGLAPAFYVFLRQRDCWNMVSPHAQERLDAAYRENLANCLARETVLSQILQLFRRVGESPVLLKGLAFAVDLYPEPAARLAGDIDLMVPLTLKDAVHRQFLQSGFKLVSQPPSPPGKLKSLLRRAVRTCGANASPPTEAGRGEEAAEEDVFQTWTGGQDILVEIHYHLINLRAGGGKAKVFHSREDGLPPTRTMQIADGEVRVLDYAAAFLHAVRHIALHHRLIGLRWHHDLALMLARWEAFLDPVQIRTRCRELNSEKILNVELAILGELFGAGLFPEPGGRCWQTSSLPWEYPLYRHVAKGGRRTPLRELVRTLLAPRLREQLQTLT
jgi:hypothetical protein